MHEADDVTLMDQAPRQSERKPNSRSSPIREELPNAPRIRWTIPLAVTTPVESDFKQEPHPADSIVYDALDLRLMDTFPASDAVARY